MSEKKRPQGMAGIEANFEGLLGTLGEKLGEVFSRLEALDGVEVKKDFKVSTAARGAGHTPQTRKPRPAKPQQSAADQAPQQELNLDLEITPNRVFVTAEVPGVSLSDLTITLNGQTLLVRGPEAMGQAVLPVSLRGDDMSVALRNGILSIEIGCSA